MLSNEDLVHACIVISSKSAMTWQRIVSICWLVFGKLAMQPHRCHRCLICYKSWVSLQYSNHWPSSAMCHDHSSPTLGRWHLSIGSRVPRHLLGHPRVSCTKGMRLWWILSSITYIVALHLLFVGHQIDT